jgi:hypothetical protein
VSLGTAISNARGVDLNAPVRYGGAWYFVGTAGSVLGQVRLYKATDPNSSWSALLALGPTDTSNEKRIATVLDGSQLHITLTRPSVPDTGYLRVDLSTETVSVAYNTVTNAQQFGSTPLVVRSSGEVVVMHRFTENMMGVVRERTNAWRSTNGTTWTSQAVSPTGVGEDYGPYALALGADDRVHVFMRNGASGAGGPYTVFQRSVSASNALGTTQTLTSDAMHLRGFAFGYGVSGARGVALAMQESNLVLRRATSINDPTWGGAETVTTTAVQPPDYAFVDVGGGTLHASFKSSSTLFVSTSTAGGAWSAQTSVSGPYSNNTGLVASMGDGFIAHATPSSDSTIVYYKEHSLGGATVIDATGSNTLPALSVSASGSQGTVEPALPYAGNEDLYAGSTYDYAGAELDTSRSASATVTLAALTTSATSTTAAPTVLATTTTTLPALTSASGATATAPTYSATAATVLSALTSASSATATPPSFAATATASLQSLTATALSTAAVPVFTATVAAVLPALTSASSATVAAPVFTASSTASLSALTSSSSATAQPPTFSATAATGLPALMASAAADVVAPEIAYLVPDGDLSSSNVTSSGGSLFGVVNEDPASMDSGYVANVPPGDASVVFSLSNAPADYDGDLRGLVIVLRARKA